VRVRACRSVACIFVSAYINIEHLYIYKEIYIQIYIDIYMRFVSAYIVYVSEDIYVYIP
jgi:hypothetical protein